jgi:hypothetical protein
MSPRSYLTFAVAVRRIYLLPLRKTGLVRTKPVEVKKYRFSPHEEDDVQLVFGITDLAVKNNVEKTFTP